MKTLCSVLLILLSYFVFGQIEYFVDKEYRLSFVDVEKDNNGDYVAILMADSVNYHYWGELIKFDNDFNYNIFIRNIDTADIHLRDFVITENNQYLIAGTIGKDEGISYDGHILYFLLVDENLNLVSEHTLEMSENYDNPQIRMFQTQDYRNYVIVYQQTYGAVFKAYIELSNEGEVIKQAFYNLAGMCMNTFPKPDDNNGFYVLQTSASPQTMAEIADVDTNLNYTTIPLQPVVNGEIYQIGSRGSCKWLNDSVYILLTEGTNANNDQDLLLYKMNDDHEFIGEPYFIGLENFSEVSLRHRGIDWVETDRIYVASWNWPSMYFAQPYYIAVINENFDVLGAKSMGGGQSNLLINSLLATDDGGCILVGGQRDIQGGNEYDWNGYVAFFKPDDIITSAAETINPNDSDYILFPNPGNDYLLVQTACKEVQLKMYDENGRFIIKQYLNNNFRNHINTQELNPGIYFCLFIDKYGNTEYKKWIKQ